MSEKTPEDVLELARRRIATNKARASAARMQEAQARAAREWFWPYAFFTMLGGLLLALLFAPGASLDWKMYAVVHGLVAQQHNVFIQGMQFPLCARNIGIYSSFLITSAYLLWRGHQRAGRLPPRPITVLLAAFVVIMTVDGFNSLFAESGQPHLYAPRNDLRTLTGIGMGTAITVAVLYVFNVALRQDIDRQQRIVSGWRDLGIILALNGLLFAAVYSDLWLLYWPLAWIMFLGIISELYVVIVLLSALFMGYGRSITSLWQLARPATIAWLPTALFIGALALLRFWLERQALVT